MDLPELRVRIEQAAEELGITIYRDHLVMVQMFGSRLSLAVDCNGVAKFQQLLAHVIKGMNRDFSRLIAQGADCERCHNLFNEYLDMLMDHHIDSPKFARGVMFYWTRFHHARPNIHEMLTVGYAL